MTTPLTIEALEALEKLERGATPGPVGIERRETDCGYIDHIVHGGPGGNDVAWCKEELDPKARQNAALIVALRNAAPRLIEAARRLNELESALEWVAIHHKGRAAAELGLRDGECPTFADATLATARALGWKPPRSTG